MRIAGLASVMMAAVLLGSAARADVEPAANWPALPDKSLEVLDGSALDFSGLFAQPPIDGDEDRLTMSRDGQLVDRHGKAQRLFCATMLFSPSVGGYPTHDQADKLARELRRHGYNLARFHFADANLMTGRKRDFDFDPEQLDRMFYLMAALKKQGVYWLVDAMSSWNGAKGDVEPHRWVKKYQLNLEIQWSDEAREHWRELVKRLWDRVNPYTKQSTLADPALIGLILVNESNIRFLEYQQREPHPELVANYQGWLKSKQSADDTRQKRWSEADSAPALAGALGGEMRRRVGGARSKDVDAFLTSRETSTYDWLRNALAEMGYRGPTTMYDTMADDQGDATREHLPWIDMHAYHDHPSGYPVQGAHMKNVSSFDNNMEYLRRLAKSRKPGRMFTVSEYGQPFWNSYRFEAAITVPTVAALQGWSAICRFSENSTNLAYGSRYPREQQLTPFMVGLDPIARSGEAIAAMLYRRGDVLAATNLPRQLVQIAGSTIKSDKPGISVISPRTEVAIVQPGESATLNHLQVVGSTARALVAATDVAGDASLAQSRRILVAVLTDALNTGMRFTDASRQTVVTGGTLPARIEPTKLQLRLQKVAAVEKFHAYALALNGERRSELRTRRTDDGALELEIDTGAVAGGPPLFIELDAR